MDFNKLKKYNWEGLKRLDLGNSYKAIFEEVYIVASQIKDLLLNFESTYSRLLPSDQEKFKNINSQFSNFLGIASSFSTIPGETMVDGLGRARVLLDNINKYYSNWLPIISDLQIYFRDELKINIENGLTNLRNEFSRLNSTLHNTVNAKVSEIDKRHTDYLNESQVILQNTQNTLNNKISELGQTISDQQMQTIKFLETNQNTFNQKLSELDEKLRIVNDTVVKVEEIKVNVEKLNESVQNSSLTSVVSEYGTIFKDQSKKDLIRSRWFGGAFIISLFIAVLIVLYWFLPLVEQFNDSTNSKGIEYYILSFTVRLTVLFFVYWIIRELLRNYVSYTHQYNLNVHRFNSLRSFEVIVRNNVLPENRDDVVKQIAQTIFAHQEDGFLSRDKKDIPFNEVVNLINALKK